jgi:hypothetical protein
LGEGIGHGPKSLALGIFGAFSIGMGTLLKITPTLGWELPYWLATFLAILSGVSLLASVSIFAYLFIPADAGIRLLTLPVFLSRNRNIVLFWFLEVDPKI